MRITYVIGRYSKFIVMQIQIQQIEHLSFLSPSLRSSQVKPTRRALTIYDKLKILKYADNLRMKQRPQKSKDKNAGKKKKRPAPICDADAESEAVVQTKGQKRHVRRGINIQAACKAHFGDFLGGMKVCLLRKRAQQERWNELTEKQQKTLYGLTDELKMAFGLQHRIKGYKCLGEADLTRRIKDNGKVQRWKVPGCILQDGFLIQYSADDLGLDLAHDFKPDTLM